MTPAPSQAHLGHGNRISALSHKHACSLCARRKVRCDKGDLCSNCVKAQAQCTYDARTPPRPRKRAADEDLLARLAQYEDLMRKHNIDFTNHANIWVQSGVDVNHSKRSPRSPARSSSVAGIAVSEDSLPVNTAAALERSLWTGIRSELQYPPTQLLRHKDDPFLYSTPPLQEILSSNELEIHELQPEPRHIYRLWQIYVETVDPLIKFVHVPTLQQRILDASWDPSNISKPLTTIVFAVYTLAVTSMKSSDCEVTFGETRNVLLMRYRSATLKALVAAEIFTTKDFETLQGLVLFLFADPESALSLSLTAVAVKLGQAMGLPRESTDPKMSFFDKEMRVRLWWQVRGLEMRANAFAIATSKTPYYDFGDLRLPLNVNDVDLHPDMTNPPMEHSGPTEMMCTLMKFEATDWIRSSSLGAKFFESMRRGPVRGKTTLDTEERAIDAIEKLYHDKFLKMTDSRIPIHNVAKHMVKRSIASMRFKIHHPRGRASVSGGDVHLTREDLDKLFNSAVISLEAKGALVQAGLSQHLLVYMTSRFEMDAYIYVISELRQRCSGSQVDLAWKLVEDLFNEHPELIENTESTFFVALGDLTLEGWEARIQELLRERGALEIPPTPRFIQLLWEKRGGGSKGSVQVPITTDPYSLDGLGPMDFYDLDSNYWTEFLRLG